MILHQFTTQDALAVQLPQLGSVFKNVDFGQIANRSVTAGIRFGADGYIYRYNYDSSITQVVPWLLKGAASSCYLFRTINSEYPDIAITRDAGTGVLMSTNRDYTIDVFVEGVTYSADIEFYISDQSDGSTVLASQTYKLEALLSITGDTTPQFIDTP